MRPQRPQQPGPELRIDEVQWSISDVEAYARSLEVTYGPGAGDAFLANLQAVVHERGVRLSSGDLAAAGVPGFEPIEDSANLRLQPNGTVGGIQTYRLLPQPGGPAQPAPHTRRAPRPHGNSSPAQARYVGPGQAQPGPRLPRPTGRPPLRPAAPSAARPSARPADRPARPARPVRESVPKSPRSPEERRFRRRALAVVAGVAAVSLFITGVVAVNAFENSRRRHAVVASGEAPAWDNLHIISAWQTQAGQAAIDPRIEAPDIPANGDERNVIFDKREVRIGELAILLFGGWPKAVVPMPQSMLGAEVAQLNKNNTEQGFGLPELAPNLEDSNTVLLAEDLDINTFMARFFAQHKDDPEQQVIADGVEAYFTYLAERLGTSRDNAQAIGQQALGIFKDWTNPSNPAFSKLEVYNNNYRRHVYGTSQNPGPGVIPQLSAAHMLPGPQKENG